MERRVLTTGGLRCDRVPEILSLVCAVSSCPEKWLATNRDVNESPMRYAYRRWDRVRESMGRLPRQFRCFFEHLATAGNSRRRRHCGGTVGRPFLPTDGR